MGSISGIEREPVFMLAYGCLKAATKYLVRKLHFEHEKLNCFDIHPGYVVLFFPTENKEQITIAITHLREYAILSLTVFILMV